MGASWGNYLAVRSAGARAAKKATRKAEHWDTPMVVMRIEKMVVHWVER